MVKVSLRNQNATAVVRLDTSVKIVRRSKKIMVQHQARPAEAKDSDSESENPGAFAAMVKSPERANWILDSDAISHMTQVTH